MKRGDGKWLWIFSLFIVLLFIFVIQFSSFVKAENSENATEWRMFMKNLNHTAWDGVSYTIISGLNIANFTTGAYIQSSPAVANGYVYFGGDDNKTYQLNASNVSQKIANFVVGAAVNFRSSPAVANGYVYIGSTDSNVYQLNASNISIHVANFTTGMAVYSSPAVANGYVYIGSEDNYLYQLNASNISQQIANFQAGIKFIDSSPAVANGYVYILGVSHIVYQLNASNISQQIASFTTGASGFSDSSSPAVANGYVYIGSNNGNVYQLNASNISIHVANFTTGTAVYSSPAVANGYVYIGSRDNNLYQLNASNISIHVANFTTGGDIDSSPAVANGYVYIGSNDNSLYQLNASNVSQKIANFTVGAFILSSPAVANGYVYFGGDDYRFYQLNATNISLGGLSSICTESWSCTAWSSCSGGIQTRTCTESNSCGTGIYNPGERQSCTSGGGLPPTPPPPTTTETITSASPGQPAVITVSNPKIDVTNITINVNQNVSNASLTVTKLNNTVGADFRVSLRRGALYQAYEINVTGMNNSEITNVTVYFKVNITWLANQNGTTNNIYLYRYYNNKWNRLPTTFLSQDTKYYYFKSISPGFSTFVVFFGEYECAPGDKRCFNNEVQLCLGNSTWLITEKCAYNCNDKGECIEEPLLSKMIYPLLIALVSVAIILILYFNLRKLSNRKKRK